jgi:hypothetical protein
MRARKISSMINSVNQQNPKMSNAKNKESTLDPTREKRIETQESVNTSQS